MKRDETSLQERYGPNTICFGCGPANQNGLRIKSHVRGERVTCEWLPAKHHEAFPGVLNGGIIGTLLDCHMNWTAAYNLMGAKGLDSPPVTVTAEFRVRLRHPTPSNETVLLTARLLELDYPRAVVESTLEAGGNVTATGRGTFVAVNERHQAWHQR